MYTEAYKTSPFNVIIRLKYHLEMKTLPSPELVLSPGIVVLYRKYRSERFLHFLTVIYFKGLRL